jgi:YVTN family beta-propeller protein
LVIRRSQNIGNTFVANISTESIQAALIANADANTVSVIDTASKAVAATVTLGEGEDEN